RAGPPRRRRGAGGDPSLHDHPRRAPADGRDADLVAPRGDAERPRDPAGVPGAGGRPGRPPRRRRPTVSAARRIVIVGASLAGAKAAETLRAEGFDGAVTLVGAEP